MVVSSTLVNVSEDAEVRLVSLLAEAAPPSLLGGQFQQDCENSITNGDAASLLRTVIQDKGAIAALCAVLPKDEAIAAVSILAALLQRTDKDSVTLSQSLADAVVACQAADVAKERETVLRKISVLSVLYNMRSDGTEKCALLERMFRLAAAYPTQLLAEQSVLGSLLVSAAGDSSTAASSATSTTAAPPRLCTLLDMWHGVDASQRRELYRTVAAALPAEDLRKQHFLLLVTESYPQADAASKQALETSQEVAIGAIRDPVTLFVHQRNLLEQPAIQALEKQDAALYGLLKVFQQGKISDYDVYCKAQGGESSLLAKYSLDAAACQKHMRILSLCSLAAEHEEIPYDVIYETLQLDSESNKQLAVESWVIAAVSSGLLQAKMDQLKKTVMVERCVVRQFDVAQWKALQSRLTSWKQNVGSILESLNNASAQQGAAAASATVSS